MKGRGAYDKPKVTQVQINKLKTSFEAKVNLEGDYRE